MRLAPYTFSMARDVNTLKSLPFTGDPKADKYLAEDPLALLIGMVLDQQVPLEKAFAGPWVLRQRLGASSTQPGSPPWTRTS